MQKTEFFEAAVQQGFYGLEKGGLYGKKDNVRKYWEDISIKSFLRPAIIDLLRNKTKLRLLDMGCGSGEGLELITHIPLANKTSVSKDFLLELDDISEYLGLDISPSMIEQGLANYPDCPSIKFRKADLSKDFFFQEEEPFDLYFSTYSSPSHLTANELSCLLEKIFSHAGNSPSYIVLDMFARYSPEWPEYWEEHSLEMLPYNMAWLYLPNIPSPEEIETYRVRYWGGDELRKLIQNIADKTGRKVEIQMKDRSIFVGRHFDTGFFNGHPQTIRYEVNRLFDRDYRGNISLLKAEISFLDKYKNTNPDIFDRIESYYNDWNKVIDFVKALMDEDNKTVKRMIESERPELSDELKMLTWLERNSSRFPVVDFWASIIGPQVACILRNLELNLPEGLGCGHGLFCIVKMF